MPDFISQGTAIKYVDNAGTELPAVVTRVYPGPNPAATSPGVDLYYTIPNEAGQNHHAVANVSRNETNFAAHNTYHGANTG